LTTNLAVSTSFGSLPTYVYPGGYDSTKLGLGPMMLQANDTGNEGKWVGPIPTNVMRPVETNAAMPTLYIEAVNYNSTYDWVICGDGAAVATSRRFCLFTFNKTVTTNPWAFVGVITVTMGNNAGNVTHRGHVVSYEKYTTGTVYIANGATTLYGVGSLWTDERMYYGCRIGIGSSDPALITTWYEISSIASNTQMTLTQAYTGSTILVGGAVPYVIEDFRILFAATNATVANGGAFMVCGLRPEIFLPNATGTTVAAATTTDKLRATYWLSDGTAASQATNQTLGGIALDAKVDWTHQNCYSCDMTAGLSRIQVNNFRAAPTSLVAGRDQSVSGNNQWVLNTGLQAVTGTVSLNNNLVLATPTTGGGPRNGKKSLFWVTTTRIYSAEVMNLTSGSTSFQSGCAVEFPPGTTTTYAVTGALNSISYDAVSDRFLVQSTGATANRSYWTQYREDVGQWDRWIFQDTRQLNQATEDPTAAIIPTTLTSAAITTCSHSGNTYMTTPGLTAILNWIFNCPYAADWEHASYTNCCVVTPAMDCSQFTSFIAGYCNEIGVIGGPYNPTLGRTGTNLGAEPGAVRMYYRTSGISDNSGTWTLLDYSGNMAGVGAATQVQARLEFRIINSSFPPRITRVCFEGTGSASTNNFQFSQKNTTLASKQFAFRQAAAFNANTPLYMRIYDAVLNSLLVTDNTTTPTGVWKYSTDGGSNWIVFACQGSGATVTFTVSGGGLNVVTTTPAAGGTGYPASSTVNLLVTGGSGTYGIVQGTTDGSGVITAFSATPVMVGSGYSGTTGAATSADMPWMDGTGGWDFNNTTTYLMYIPASIADNVDAMPILGTS
jgi:hypothetical protein